MFDPSYLIKYEAADIVTVESGFNVGAELGGRQLKYYKGLLRFMMQIVKQ